ncbi:MAG TPA: zinc-dependent metalloprotease [Bacteriovoracaceae bacterium]|nr:zinc-dependent metalloprotease [Bacteriovoracaceae bacterium]
MKLKSSVLSLCTLAVLSSACMELETANPFKSKSNRVSSNRVTNQVMNVNKPIGDDKIKFQVISESLFKQKSLSNKILSVNSPLARKIINSLPKGDSSAPSIASADAVDQTVVINEESLILGFPMGLIGEQCVFGGVITKVSDKTSEGLGTLKLTDLPALNVRTLITQDENSNPVMTLVGCAYDCNENSEQVGLVSFPIVGLNQETGMLMIDLAPIGKELDLITMLDPKGEATKLKAISSATTAFDYSYSTLVFDIANKMIPVTADVNDTTAPVTEFTVRWYLKLTSGFNPAFTSREPTPGVGFFQTERGSTPKITRFSTTNNGNNVHYYIKDVPAEFRSIFAGALDNWNVEFKKQLGRNLLTYEFVETTDARYAELVTGDIRYNIIEWDLNNRAGYGGLGPSIANQLTGETISANVLIQGPNIVDMYTKWFGVSQQVTELQASGLASEANQLLKKFHRDVERKTGHLDDIKYSLKLGKTLTMNIPSQRPELHDPIYKGHFEIVPKGVTYKEYMTGYFTEMLEHELGHNLGLRHNFKGNLGAFEDGSKGSVSRSIMEYMGRPYRHLNAIGLYDKMALAFGYKGEAPTHLNWFCTDEDQGSNATSLLAKSPECTKSDATSDPYSFWENRLSRVLDLLLDSKTTVAPIWTVKEIITQIDETVMGLSAYALSAEKTSATWSNFFGKGNRPEVAADVKAYVLESFKTKLCDAKLAEIIGSKETPEAQALAQANLAELQKAIATKTGEWNLFKAEDLNCL